MKYYILLILFIFLGCASQIKPNGGPIDQEGPNIINIFPINKSIISDYSTKIILEFDEAINPISVVNSISIQNFSEFDYKVKGKKIIITPKDKWPVFNIIKITITRNITDMLNNPISYPIQLFYFNEILNNNKIIQGKIINIDDDIFELGLYQIINNEYVLIEKIQSDLDGRFQFSYLKEGQYIVLAVQNIIENIIEDIKIKKFGFITQDSIDLIKNDTSLISIRTDFPLEQLFIKSFKQINNSFGHLILNDGSEYPFVIPIKDSIKKYYSKGDSLFAKIILKNRIEKYFPPKFKIFINEIIDTTPPIINKRYFKNERYHIIFNEPIKNAILYYDVDSIINPVQYNFSNDFSIEFKPQFNSKFQITSIEDLYNNETIDTVFIDIEPMMESEEYQGGNIYGNINYEGEHPIIVKAENLNLDYIYYSFSDSNKFFSFLNIKSGFYRFSAYEILGDYDSSQYFSGNWPFKRAAKFGQYHEVLEVRSLWDIKDMKIIVK